MYTSLGTCKCIQQSLREVWRLTEETRFFFLFFKFVLFIFVYFCLFEVFHVCVCVCVCVFFVLGFLLVFLCVFFVILLFYLFITLFIDYYFYCYGRSFIPLCFFFFFFLLHHHHHLIHLLDCPKHFDATLYKGFVDVYYVYPI